MTVNKNIQNIINVLFAIVLSFVVYQITLNTFQLTSYTNQLTNIEDKLDKILIENTDQTEKFMKNQYEYFNYQNGLILLTGITVIALYCFFQPSTDVDSFKEPLSANYNQIVEVSNNIHKSSMLLDSTLDKHTEKIISSMKDMNAATTVDIYSKIFNKLNQLIASINNLHVNESPSVNTSSSTEPDFLKLAQTSNWRRNNNN